MRTIRGWLNSLFGGLPAAAPTALAGAEEEQVSAAQPAAGRPGKQAVVIVHGMGEQIPMDTLRGFVHAIWETDPSVADQTLPNPNMTWSKPDDRTGSLELRRITTRESVCGTSWPNGVRTDFYELYWADLTAGSTWQQFVAWVRYLLFRPLSRVPRDVRSAWFLLWGASVLVLVLALLPLLPQSWWDEWPALARWRWLLILLAGAIGAFVHRMATSTFGRVVRYTRAYPDNIAARAAVRERGLELLRALHRGDDYSRIILVGHSLGSMLAYDLLSYYWAERSDARTILQDSADEFAALCEMERQAAALEATPTAANLEAWRAAQSGLRKRLAARPAGEAVADGRWLISDFVTMGSPLTHAEFLVASSPEDLEERKRSRELPTSPPYRESLDPSVLEAAQASGTLPIGVPPESTTLAAFPTFGSPAAWVLHHAAPFAAVRWTNVHDPSLRVFNGDVISGPLAATLGPGIRDIDLKVLRGQANRVSHTCYWSLDMPAPQIAAVRQAVNLLDI